MNLLTAHRDPDRQQMFGDNQDRLFFDTASRCWVVTDPDLSRNVLMSSRMVPSDYVQSYATLEDRLGIDFSVIRHVLGHIPLCVSGPRHADLRRRTGMFLAERRADIAAFIQDEVPGFLSVLAQPGRREVMSELIVPLVSRFNQVVMDVQLPDDLGLDHASIIFDRSLGVTRRQQIETELGLLKSFLEQELGPNADADDIAMRMSLFILGKDALLGTLGESLRVVFEACAGRRLDACQLPGTPPATGVGFAERVVRETVDIGGKVLEPGERIRVMLQANQYSADGPASARFFGAGQHACLGRPVSLDLWNAFVVGLSKIPQQITIHSHSYRTDNYIFTCPEILEVDVT